MNLTGDKVLLRAIEPEDSETLRAMINDPEIERMVWGYSFPVSRKGQADWISSRSGNNDIFRAMIDVDGEGIGTIMLSDIDLRNGSAEIHIKLADRNMRGKGYGTDAVKTLVRYAFRELRLNCIYSRVNANNTASKRMFLKCGFCLEGILRARVYKDGSFQDFEEYSILSGEFRE